MAEEIIFKVGEDDVLHSFQVLLGTGSYVNLLNRETGEVTNMVNRAFYRAFPSLAWKRHADELNTLIDNARVFAIGSQRKLSMLRRVVVHYSRKEDEIAAARDNAHHWLMELQVLMERKDHALQTAQLTAHS